ncbi:MAG: hypothetical protein IJ155_06460 [Prevotella sp.]|nr:hypothetical protein [Prevotella sp.]
MKSIGSKLYILLLSALVGLTACTNDSNPVVNPEDSDESGVFMQDDPDYSSVVIDAPVFISASIKAEVREGLQAFLTNITSLDDAEVAVVRDEDIGTYDGELLAFYQRGGFIIVAQPDGDRYREFAAKYDLPNALPFNASQEVLLYATSKKREHYVLYATNPFDPEEIEDPLVLSMLEQNAQSYYKRRIFEICRWLKDQRTGSARTRAAVQLNQFKSDIFIDESDVINLDFSVPMKNVVADRKTSKADWIDANGSVVVKYTVYSAYVFEGNKQPGDYYIVRTDLLVRNGSVFSSFKKKHGLVTHWGTGYYMKRFDLSSAMVDPSKYTFKDDDDRETREWKYRNLQEIANYMMVTGKVHKDVMVPGISFYSSPSPGTTIGSTSYTSGINIGLNGSLSAGSVSSAGLAFSASHSKSETVNISDITIEVNTEAESQAVTNSYITKPIGSFTFPDGHDEKDVVNLIPLVARSDFNAQSVWCWAVPVSEAVRDSSDASFMLATCFDYEYASYVHSSDDLFYPDGYHKSFHAKNYSYAQIPHPSRVPFGVIALKNNETLAIYNIRIWAQDDKAGQGDPLYVVESGYQPGEEALCAVPVGTYYIEFSMKYKQQDKPTNIVESRWKIESVEVKKAIDQESATTKISSGIAELIE